MTDGPGHYEAAEKLLAEGEVLAAEAVTQLDEEGESEDPLLTLVRALALLSAANTRAVLALTAASAANIRRNGHISQIAADLDETNAYNKRIAHWHEVLHG